MAFNQLQCAILEKFTVKPKSIVSFSSLKDWPLENLSEIVSEVRNKIFAQGKIKWKKFMHAN